MTFSTMVFVTNQRLFKDIYGWSVGYRETSYANRMTWSHWEDRVEEVLTLSLSLPLKNKELSNGNSNDLK